MKKQIAMAAAAFIFLTIFSGTASAGSSKRHTVEGIIIGAGVTLLGAAIIHNISRPEPIVVKAPAHRHRPPVNRHWQTERVWVPGVTQTRWNPGHYTPHGRWIPGHHQNFVVSEGHWETRRTWIADNCR